MRLFCNHRKALVSLVLLSLLAGTTVAPAGAAFTAPDGRPQQAGMLSRLYYQMSLQIAARGGIGIATELMERSYRLNDTSVELGLTYIGLLQAQGNLKKAVQEYELLLDKADDPKVKSLIYYYISLSLDTMNQLQSAIRAMEQAIQVYPDNPPPATYYYDIGVLYAKLNQYEKTLQYTQKAVELAPQSSEAWNNLGYSLAKLGDYQKGIAAVEKSLEINPHNPNALDSKGYILFNMGRFKESILEFEKAIQLDPKLTESYLYLGKSYEALEDWEKAIVAYERLLELSPSSEERAEIQEKLRRLREKNFFKKTVSPFYPETEPDRRGRTKVSPAYALPQYESLLLPQVEMMK